jgi:hypothetical protein
MSIAGTCKGMRHYTVVRIEMEYVKGWDMIVRIEMG